MFAGAGSVMNQWIGWPQVVGSILIGVIAAVVVFGGLKAVENVLGYAGIIIIIYVIIFGFVALASPDTSFEQARIAEEAVAEGLVWQANMFEMPPFSWFISDPAAINGPFIEGLCYCGVCVVTGLPFYITLGRTARSFKESTISGIFSAVFFMAGMTLSVVILMTNFGSIVNLETQEMFPFPTLAAVQAMVGNAVGSTYFIIIVAGIFTTITGYLYVITERIFPGEPSMKSRILTAVLMVIGVILGGILPFSAVVNFLWPISGFAGIIIVIAMLIRDIRAAAGGGKKAEAA
jgi:uncharacterized membrane protein YkvI